MSGTVQINYETMDEIGRRFGQQAEVCSQVAQRLAESLHAVENGGWDGEGSVSFFAEMNDELMPAVQRLASAMQEGSTKTQEIARIFREAEETTRGGLHGTTTGPELRFRPGDGSPSQQFMAAIERPIPRPQGTEGYDTLAGAPVKGVGNATTINRTAESMLGEFSSIEEKQEQLEATEEFFNSTISEESKDVEAAKKDLSTSLPELNKKNRDVYGLIREYQQEGREIQIAEARALAAESGVDEAIHGNAAAKIAVDRVELQTEKMSLETQRRILEDRIAEKTENIKMLSQFTEAALEGKSADWAKQKATEFVRDKIVGELTENEVTRLAEIDSKIDALDEAIRSTTDHEVRRDLEEARSRVEKAFYESTAANLEARYHKLKQWGALDQLADIEENHGTGTLFQELQEYKREAHYAASELRKESEAYTNALNSGGIARAGEMADLVEQDLSLVEDRNPNPSVYPNWKRTARNTKGYFESVERWRQSELRRYNDLTGRLRQENHLDLVDRTIAEAEKALGGTVDADRL